jgi:hypothetical protein
MRAIRFPPLRSGRRLRWAFEVSADVDGEAARIDKNLEKNSAEQSRS